MNKKVPFHPQTSWNLKTPHLEEPWVWMECFSKEECDKIIELGRKLDIEQAKIGGLESDSEINYSIRRSNVGFFSVDQDTEWLFRKLTDLINQVNAQYYNFDLEEIESLQFSHYTSEDLGCYTKHIDMLYRTWKTRKLSVSIQLNDPVDYEGGELTFHGTGTEVGDKNKQGVGIFFPSWSVHEVTPVTKGERYSLVAWIVGPRFK